MASSEGWEGMNVDIIKPQVDRFVFPVAHDVIVPAGRPWSNLGFYTGHLSFEMSCSFTVQVPVCLLRNLTRTKGLQERDFQLLPKEIDAKVAKIALPLKVSGVSESDIFVSSTCNFNIVTLDRMKKKKYNLIVGNIGHFDNEINWLAWELGRHESQQLQV